MRIVGIFYLLHVIARSVFYDAFLLAAAAALQRQYTSAYVSTRQHTSALQKKGGGQEKNRGSRRERGRA